MKVVGGLYRLREQPALDPVMGRIVLPMKDIKEHCCVWNIESKGGPFHTNSCKPG